MRQTSGGLDRLPTDKELNGGIVGYGIGNIICALFGGLPTATFSQNVGIVTTTKVVNRCVLGMAAGILLVAGLIPKFSSVLTTIPYCVLGGATVSVFASIAMNGMKLITSEKMNYRNTSIVGLAAALGIGYLSGKCSTGNFPGLGNDDLRKITGRHRDTCRSSSEYHSSERKRRKIRKKIAYFILLKVKYVIHKEPVTTKSRPALIF